MSLKDITYLELWQSLHSVERNDLCKGHYEEQFCEIILKWTSGSGENVIKRHFLFRALAAPLFGGAEPFVQFW